MAGYWQIQLDESREKTAFVTHASLFEFNVMPFGLCNATICFQRLMECVLRGINWKIALIYLDDILVRLTITFNICVWCSNISVKQLTDQIQDIRECVKHLKPATTSTTTDILAYIAFAITLFHCLLFIFLYFYLRRTQVFHNQPPHFTTCAHSPCPAADQTKGEPTSL